MTVATPTQAPTPTPPSEPRYPWQMGLAMVGLALLLGVVFFAATRVLNSPAIDDRAVAPTETAIAKAVATAAAAPTPVSQARTAPQPTPAPPQPTAVPTLAAAAVQVAPTAAPTSAPTSAPSSQPTARAAADSAVFSPTITPVDPALDEEVRAAYLHYLAVRDQALYTNDPTQLDTVADGAVLSGIKQAIADQQAEGKAQVVNVAHHYGIYHIEGDPSDVVALVDDSNDLSYWVDATTHEPLPGQKIPSTEEQAPQVSVVYRLRNIDGIWKVTEGHPNVGSQVSP
jgi:hypothetical protein